MSEQPKRRLVLPERKTRADLQVQPVAEITADKILEDALATVSIEVLRYRTKVARGNILDLKEARVLQGYIKAMVELSKEQRDRERFANFDKLSDDELFALAKKALGATSIPEAEKILSPNEVETETDNDETDSDS